VPGDGGILTAVFGRDGDVFIGERYRIRRVANDGTIDTVAGAGETAESCWNAFECCSDDSSPARETRLLQPILLAADAGGAVYFRDWTCEGQRIRVLRPLPEGP
jgi:hypothetical protein